MDIIVINEVIYDMYDYQWFNKYLNGLSYLKYH